MGYRVAICLAFLLSFFDSYANDLGQASVSTAQSTTNSTTTAKRRFVGLTGGILNYPTSSNVQQVNGAGGVSIGVTIANNFWIEGGVIYSYQEMADSIGNGVSDVDQFSLLAKPAYHWDISDFWLTPILGAAVSYTIRSYNAFSSKSNAFNIGPIVGLDVDLTNSIVVGLEYRYMMSMGYSSDVESGSSPRLKSKTTNVTQAKKAVALESLNYQVFMLNAKWKF